MKTWEQRVQELEAEGLTRSDAQAVVDAEDAKEFREREIKWTEEKQHVDDGE